ncbi:MAG: HlyD family efflux transporter periplasmic adaptor subunit, partial [Proteobacteria bacterium]|nr:HlyD family efflux transporter periplasmic adaptor subunit [Pseudomonadota bacterium]
RAPFAGFIEDVNLEIGDYVQPGAPCATLVDMNPMLMVGRVGERLVQRVNPGMEAIGSFGDKTEVRGPITFVGQQDDPKTRTYAIEVELDNADGTLRSGLTAQIRIPIAQALAQKVSPALFSLDDNGGYGVRVVNDDNRVEFYTVDVIAEDSDGVWVTGLPNETKIITVGQELVVSGERVDPVLVNTSLATSSASSLTLAGS